MYFQRLYKVMILAIFVLVVSSNFFLLRRAWVSNREYENYKKSVPKSDFGVSPEVQSDANRDVFSDTSKPSASKMYQLAISPVRDVKVRPTRSSIMPRDRIPIGPFQQFYPLDVNLPEIVAKVQRGENVDVPVINRFNCSTIIGRLCTGEPQMLYIIKSHPRKIDSRMAIRRTWGNESMLLQMSKRIFVLGTSPEEDIQTDLHAENKLYQDLVQGNFPDIYSNTGTKMEFAIHWAVKYCGGANYTVFLDDDVLLNPKGLRKLLKSKQVRQTKRLYLGWFKGYHPPVRNNNSKWYVSFEDYPLSEYPPLAPAGTYVLNQELAREVDIGMRFVKKIRFDDVYLSLVIRKLGVPPFHTDLIGPNPGELSNASFIAKWGEFSPEALTKAWEKFHRFF